jgi:site-specific DNA recombinase
MLLVYGKLMHLRKEMNKQGLKVSRNRFWSLLRDPFYYGMIRIKEYKNEREELVKGLHAPIISEELFNEVQYVLSGKKKIKAKKSKAKEELALRGFLVCSCCGKNLTGSASKGNGGTYYYYHCQSGCKERFKSDIAHTSFNNWLTSISIKPEIASLYIAVMEDVFKTNEGDREAEIKKINQQIATIKDKQGKVAESLIEGGLDKHDYKMLKEKYAMQIVELKNRIDDLKSASSGFAEFTKFGFSLLSNLSYYYNQSNLENKQKMIGLIFPEKLVFSNSSYRTTKPNELLTLMCNNINELGVVKTKKTSNNESLSLVVARTGIEPVFEE